MEAYPKYQVFCGNALKQETGLMELTGQTENGNGTYRTDGERNWEQNRKDVLKLETLRDRGNHVKANALL